MMIEASNQFHNCVVYCIINKEKKLVYYGSTTQALKTRLYDHKKPSNNTSSRQLFENEKENNFKNIVVQVLHRGDFETMKDLHIQEKLYIKNHSCSIRNIYNCINQVIPTRSRREYYLDNKPVIYARNERWRKNNKEKTRLYARNLYHKNKEKILQKIECECGSKFCKSQTNRHLRSIKHQKYLKDKELLNETENENQN